MLQVCNGNGCCSAYEGRPSECRIYTCGWIDGHVPANWRPDRCGILFEAGFIEWPYRINVLHGFELRPGAIEENRRNLVTAFRPGTAAIIAPFEARLPPTGSGHQPLHPEFDHSIEPQFFGRPDDVAGLKQFYAMCRSTGSLTLRMADADVEFKTS